MNVLCRLTELAWHRRHLSHAHTRVIKGIPHMHILDGLERAFARKRRLTCVQFRSATNEAVSEHGTLLLAVAPAPAFEARGLCGWCTYVEQNPVFRARPPEFFYSVVVEE